ncbi:MAG TPA: hypothetical protein VEW68_05495, partial [Patescibacteria group bacterium]|nr:hypothetical protein [Patescibacteria group bacterium]
LQSIVNAGVTSIGLLVAIYYSIVGIACTVYYRKALTRHLRGFVFAGVVPLLSAAILLSLGGYIIYTDWISANSFAFDASNGWFLVAVPVVTLLAAIPALLWAYVRRHPKYMSMPTESAPATALD